ncbi:MAG TPA: DNA helicase UvrD [Candidatus Woesearchaeota archaeon]|nr:DNA helicase UvrD [Candidatus Woesearchaeota archaeon]
MIFADLHIHSRFSRATSSAITIPNLEKWARVKGLGLLATGDFTHPEWLREIRQSLSEDGTGFLKTEKDFSFVLQSEVSLAYSQDNKARKVHFVLLSKDIDTALQVNEALSKHGSLASDGRPTLGIAAPEFIEKVKEIDNLNEVIPAHAWTPWFGIFGSKSGFDSLEECCGDKHKKIYALETGLSSNPAMNRLLSSLDRLNLVSNSDSHSFWPWRLGREANILDIKMDYKSLINSIREKEGFMGTIEVDPAYGKYHFDGHRNCEVSLEPNEALKFNKLCPKCRRPLTIGVLSRVNTLADRAEPKQSGSFRHLIPLSEIISALNGTAPGSKKTWETYNALIAAFGNEFNVLLNTPFDDLCRVVAKELAEVIIQNREGKIQVSPGYDGVYGKAMIKPYLSSSQQKQQHVAEKPGPNTSFKNLKDFLKQS